jgi:hypothetical protein
VKLIVIAAVAGALLAIGGVGYAWGGGNGCDGDHHHGGCTTEPSLNWVSPTFTKGGPHSVVCLASATPSVLSAAATGLLPGGHCWLNATLENTGNGPEELVPHITATLPPGCTVFTYTDNLLGASPYVELAQGHTFAYQAEYGLGPTAGNSCEKVTASFQVTITAQGSSSCQGFPFNPSVTPKQGCCG